MPDRTVYDHDTGTRRKLIEIEPGVFAEAVAATSAASGARGNAPAPAAGSVQAVGSKVGLYFDGVTDLSAFSFHILGHTTGTFTIERTLSANPATAPDNEWTTVGAFKAGTRTSKGVWADSPGAYHGNASAASGIRIRVTVALNNPAAVRLIVGAGTGTITIGAIASNEGNVIGAVAMLSQHYSSAEGGRVSFNASTGIVGSTGTTEQELAALVNPAGSGIDVRIEALVPGATATAAITRYRIAAANLTGLGTPSTALNRGGGDPVAKARLYPRGAYTRGAVIGQGKVDFVSGKTERDPVGGGLILRPGDALVWGVRASGNTNTGYDATLEAVWWETTAGA